MHTASECVEIGSGRYFIEEERFVAVIWPRKHPRRHLLGKSGRQLAVHLEGEADEVVHGRLVCGHRIRRHLTRQRVTAFSRSLAQFPRSKAGVRN